MSTAPPAPAHACDGSPAPLKVLQGFRRRIAGTIGILAGGVVAILLFLAFLGPRFTWYQDLAVVLSILIVAPSMVVALWVSWGLSSAGRLGRWGRWHRWDDLMD